MEQCILEGDDDQGNGSASTNFVSSIWSLLRSRISQRPSPTTTVQGCYMALAAILGTLVRMTLAQLFGEECRNPGSVGWLASEAALCVTTEGESDQVGGIIFADLPANVLGTFLMGLLQDGKSLGLAVHAPIAWLTPDHAFQGCTILHLALRTGFCGSLTTFSSWNSEMVVMMVGEFATHRQSQFWKALFGYIVGIETALGSYVFGRTAAYWLHKWQNPNLGLEAAAVRVKESEGYVVNASLPPFERRYLPDLSLELPDGEYPPSDETTPGLCHLSIWRASTREARRLDHPASTTLQELEMAILVDQTPITSHIVTRCHKYEWNLIALMEYTKAQMNADASSSTHLLRVRSSELSAAGIRMDTGDDLCWFQRRYAFALIAVVVLVLAIVMVFLPTSQGYQITNRTMVYSLLFSAPGALLRWRLSKLNSGELIPYPKLSWLPIGTLTANVLGSLVFIAMIASEYRLEENNVNVYSGFWTIATLRAIKVGFCGCLTTVSTFISEVHGFTLIRKQDRAYKYIAISLLTSSSLAMALFAAIVYTAPNY